jgi:hypothetical protein
VCDHGPVTSPGEAASVAPAPADEAAETGIGESRWPPAIALVAFMALNIGLRVWLPHEGAVRVPWLVPAIEAVLLLALLVGNPGNAAKHGKWPRRVIVTLVVVLVAAAL